MPTMDPSLAPLHYAHDRTLFRRRKDGSFKQIRTVNGGRLITTFDGERIDAAAVVWCLRYGNWPKFPLAIVDGDPTNLDFDNIFPVRLRGVRYILKKEGKLFQHPLSEVMFRTAAECRAHWVVCAREFYAKDLNYVLALESREREMREKVPATKSRGLLDWEARQKARRAELAARLERNRLAAAENGTAVMPKKPKDIKGMVWHYYQKQWVSVPVPVHVSDDCRRRCCAYLRGAVRSEYQRHADETFYFDKDDNPVLPLPVVKKKRQAGKTETVSANA